MAERKDFDEANNQETKHIDFKNDVTFPETKEDVEDKKQSRLIKAGLDKKEFIYDEDVFNSIKNINLYPQDSQMELKLWISEQIHLDPSIFDDAEAIPSLERLKLFRFGYANCFNMEPYIKYQNEYDDETLEQLLMYNLYLYDYDQNGEIKKDANGIYEHATLNIPEDRADREKFFELSNDYLIVAGMENISDFARKNVLFNRGFAKSTIDAIIVGYANAYNVFDACNELMNIGILQSIPEESVLKNMIKKETGKDDDAINNDISWLCQKVIDTLKANGKCDIISAKDLIIESKQQIELIKETERKQQTTSYEEPEGVVPAVDEDEEEPEDDGNSLVDVPDESESQQEQTLDVNTNVNNEHLEFVNDEPNDRLLEMVSGHVSKKTIAEEFETEIRRLKMLEEAILRSIK